MDEFKGNVLPEKVERINLLTDPSWFLCHATSPNPVANILFCIELCFRGNV
jgi:hypothetical protein